MEHFVHTGAQLACNFGSAPSKLAVPPKSKPTAYQNADAANILDHVPVTNIPPFGMCSSLSNPAVVAATSAALGVLTPQPCTPVIPAPWTPGEPTILLDSAPALNEPSTCACTLGGVISITSL